VRGQLKGSYQENIYIQSNQIRLNNVWEQVMAKYCGFA